MMDNPEFRVRGFAGSRILMETVHSSESSAAIEVGAWQNRMKRGEVSRVELIDLRPNGTLTNLKAVQHALARFVEAGLLLHHPGESREYSGTEGLKLYVESLCAVQWPVRIWARPVKTVTA